MDVRCLIGWHAWMHVPRPGMGYRTETCRRCHRMRVGEFGAGYMEPWHKSLAGLAAQRQAVLREKYGTPEAFEHAIRAAEAQLFVTASEADAAIRGYRDLYEHAGRTERETT